MANLVCGILIFRSLLKVLKTIVCAYYLGVTLSPLRFRVFDLKTIFSFR